MFHDSHELNRIVADFLNARQDVVGERPVSVDLALGRTEVISDVKIDLELQPPYQLDYKTKFSLGRMINKSNLFDYKIPDADMALVDAE